jgi:hypothetical protein
LFVSGIGTAARYTRPIHTITRVWGSTTVIPGAATLFFVNADGWALTCKHVASQLAAADQVLAKFAAFKTERAQLPTSKKSRHLLRALERKHGYANGVPIEMYNRFINCVEGPLQLEARLHASVDVALLKFNNFTKLGPDTFATFAQNGTDLKQGKVLCRLGFPFPEFTNFEYDAAADQIRWTTTGRSDSPQFPIDGMVTRHLQGPGGGVIGFELSTPGLKGQSGGPAFDSSGRVWGMQAATNHLDLDFDVDMDVLRNGQKRRVKDSAFLHVGHCIHVDVLKQFMRDNGVTFQEAA